MSYRKLHAPITPDQSAAIPYRIRSGRIEILLITTRKQGKWIIPKGSIESDLSAHTSAAKEAHEEAGVKGRISAVSLGCYRHGDAEEDPIVEVFLMRVEREEPSWPEEDDRERRWVSLDEAYLHVEEEGLRSILDDAASTMRLALNHADASKTEAAHPAVPEEPSRRSA